MSLLTIFEPLAEQVLATLPSDIATLETQLNGATSAVAGAASPTGSNTGAGPQAAAVQNLAKHMGAMNTATFNTLTKQIGTAVAETATAWLASNPSESAGAVAAYLSSPAGIQAIEALVNVALAALSIAVPAAAQHTLLSMIYNGIEMYDAGIGTQSTTISAPK